MSLIATILLLMLSNNVLYSQTMIEPEGRGTKDEPYRISSLKHLHWLSMHPEAWHKAYQQTQNIDASETKHWNVGDHDGNPQTPDSAQGFSPIGTSIFKYFSGSYDGNNFTIDSLYINRPLENHVGLFGFVQTYSHGNAIKNVRLNAVTITGNGYVGGLIGYNNRATLSQCYVSGVVTGKGDCVGGIIGDNYYQISMSGCVFEGQVFGGGDQVGGLIGNNISSWISKSHASGKAFGKGNHIGGLIGRSLSSEINEVYSIQDVASQGGQSGGLVGYAKKTNIRNCYSTGNVEGSWQVGGLIGFASSCSIEMTFSTGHVTGYSATGGLVGQSMDANVIHSYWNQELSGQAQSDGGVAKNTRAMLKKASFQQWDFETVWTIENEMSYPGFQWQADLYRPQMLNFSTVTLKR